MNTDRTIPIWRYRAGDTGLELGRQHSPVVEGYSPVDLDQFTKVAQSYPGADQIRP